MLVKHETLSCKKKILKTINFLRTLNISAKRFLRLDSPGIIDAAELSYDIRSAI